MSPVRRDFPDALALGEALAERVAGDLAAALAARGRAGLALPGGTTPGPFLEALAGRSLDWARIEALPGDERWLPEDHPRSNIAMLRRHLAAARLLPLYREGLDAATAARHLAPQVERLLPLDVCVLGMGADGHTASLFPGAPDLDAALDPGAPPLMAIAAPGAPEPRLTLTAPVLQAARRAYIMIVGPDKAAALERSMAPGPAEVYPVRVLLRRPGPIEVFCVP